MKIEKEFELKTNKDLYALESTNNFIITNDGYSGITILDNTLNIVKNIELFDGITIYFIYKHSSKDEVLLFCHDNSCMVWVNLLDFSYKIISLNGIDPNVIFSPIYFWKEDICILTTYKNEFYLLDNENIEIKKVSNDIIKSNYSEVYNFLNKVIEHLPCYPLLGLNKHYIAKDSLDNSIVLINEARTTIKLPDNFVYHDIAYINHNIACIGESLIQIIDLKNIKDSKTFLLPEKNYQFLRAKFYFHNKKLNLITLSGGTRTIQNSLITTYMIG